jgi:hypothetical protein
MTPEERERVNALCREIQVERDPARLLVLIEELTKLLTQREQEVGLNDALSNH